MRLFKRGKGVFFSDRSKAVFFKATGLAVIISSIMLLVNCAPQGQVNMLERRINGLSAQNTACSNQLNSMKKEVSDLRKAMGDQDISSMVSRQADFGNRIDELQAELLRLNGMIEQIGHQQEKQEEAVFSFRNEFTEQLENLREEVRLLQSSTKVTRQVEQARKDAAQGAIDLYQQALDLIKQKKYEDAKKTLKTYIEKHPHDKRVANAYFWMGECEYNLQRFEEAILEYQKVISDYPQSNKVPDSLLKQGMAFRELGDRESAKILFDKLIKKYPNSPQASVAKKKLQL